MNDDLPVIATPRLELRVAGPDCAQQIAQFNRDNETFLAPWEPAMSPAAFDPDAVAQARARAVSDASAGRAYAFVLYPGGSQGDVPPIGFLDFTNVIRGVFQACNMGYKLDRQAQGHGYMTEAAQGAIDYLFNTVHLHRIMAGYMPHNQRSAAVLRRLGFGIEGTAKSYLFIAGRWRDHVLTSLVNADSTAPPGYEAADG